MTHQKIFIREDGTKFKIVARLWVETIGDIHNYNISVWECKPKKKKWVNVINTDDYRYRNIPMGNRKEYERKLFLAFVTTEEILSTKIELWNKLKPE